MMIIRILMVTIRIADLEILYVVDDDDNYEVNRERYTLVRK